MKKILILTVFFILSFSISGCSSADRIELSDDESDAIAQYCAHLLLKYDKNKTDDRKLLDIDELKDIYKESDNNLETDDVTATPTPVPTSSENSSETPSASPSPSPAPTGSENTEDDVKSEASLSVLYESTGLKVEPVSCEMSKTYMENEVFTITAKDTEEIAAVKFLIKNESSGKIEADLSECGVQYLLYCKSGSKYSPTLSMLSNDIQFLDVKIEAGGSQEAVLLFIVNKGEEVLILRAVNDNDGKVYDKRF